MVSRNILIHISYSRPLLSLPLQRPAPRLMLPPLIPGSNPFQTRALAHCLLSRLLLTIPPRLSGSTVLRLTPQGKPNICFNNVISYSSRLSHCHAGMVFAANAPASKSFATFQNTAKSSASSSSGNSTGTASSTSASATSSSAALGLDANVAGLLSLVGLVAGLSL